jgi:periplasmic divalent cation tolerance protein
MVVLTTAPDPATAEALAERLLSERLIACANILPGARSIYRWGGEVQREEEVVVLLKTTGEAFAAVSDRLVQLHPYDVPEVLALSVASGLDAYLRWVGGEVAVGDG